MTAALPRGVLLRGVLPRGVLLRGVFLRSILTPSALLCGALSFDIERSFLLSNSQVFYKNLSMTFFMPMPAST